jgi:hypothetical protein
MKSILITLLLASTVLCSAQQPTTPPPTTNPEVLHERLEKLKAQELVLIDTLDRLEEFKALNRISQEIKETAAEIEAAKRQPTPLPVK